MRSSWELILYISLTVLSTILSTQDGQSFTDSRSNHEGVSGTQAILVRLSQSEFLEIES